MAAPVHPTEKCVIRGCGSNRLMGDVFCKWCGTWLRMEYWRDKGGQLQMSTGEANTQRLDPPETPDGKHYLGRIHNTAQLVQCIANVQASGRVVIEEKNLRYAGNGDPFANLRRHGAYGLVVRMDDKVARLSSLLKPGATIGPTVDESAYDTAMDLMNYAGILLAWMCDQKGKEAVRSASENELKK